MAEVADLFFLPFDEIYGEEQVDDQDYYYHNETLDLVALDSSAFPVLDSADDMGSDYLGIGLGLGGFAYEARRSFAPPASLREPLDPCAGEGEGLRVVVGFDSDSDSVVSLNAGGPESPLCWNSLRIDEERATDRAEELDWEEVDGGHAYDREVEVLSMLVGSAEEDGSTRRGESDDDDGHSHDDLDAGRSIDWEVLLAVDASGRNPAQQVFEEDEDEDLLNTSEYEILTGQLAGYYDRSGRMGSPPAARSVVESLPVVVLTGEDSLVCAVCKDEMSLQEHVARLPCSHDYHRQCILPWLAIRNTCPVCRYELPTDDPEYENWRARRGAGLETARDGYDLESFSAI
ncbi:E3 ubiquitin-protein ligase CIP8-like [Ananas comosus]|uniref:RING-type E3 ubiquitin transferase n=2 Tax=Ananas comosus TaxID=4615 RepID=A0A199VIZ5_ANACO|nr:E3 ubiquitin-protein ligase CIP8-like [Ananas comosus]OAY76978.1 E3 ubiquitin-protein ligase RING1 [Ananas comosus]CAD1831561.1 unnamed protein product [Ananas comosus var. bracteatus]